MDRNALVRATAVGTVLQLAMVVTGHFVPAVAALFGPLGVTISLVAGLLYARAAGGGFGSAVLGGLVAGGLCAFLGIVVSFLLGDVTAVILGLGTASSAATGAVGGLIGPAVARPRAA